MPDGSAERFLGGTFTVPAGEADELLELFELLDEGDPYEIAGWVRELDLRTDPFAGPAIRRALDQHLTFDDDEDDGTPWRREAAFLATPDGAAMLDEIRARYEASWCERGRADLDGRTPREAAADPAGRPALLALIDDLDADPDLDNPVAVRPARLRALLGLTDPADPAGPDGA